MPATETTSTPASTDAWVRCMAGRAIEVRSERAGKTLSLSAEHDIQCAINALNVSGEDCELVAAEVRRIDALRARVRLLECELGEADCLGRANEIERELESLAERYGREACGWEDRNAALAASGDLDALGVLRAGLSSSRTEASRTHASVRYGDLHQAGKRYCVVQGGVVVLAADSKIDCITEAQRRNGYAPVDGSESTYGRQLEADGKR